ncbi:MAG TPA: trypsin-like peptidase domain-containing protein, partial [Longimicrobium sp.]
NDEHALGDFVNIIQYPAGGRKRVVVRENQLVVRQQLANGTEPVLQYVADTLDSSSGSPVFNDEWNVMALHHSTVPAGDITICGNTRLDVVNEGTRASVIVEALSTQRDALPTDEQKRLLDAALRE